LYGPDHEAYRETVREFLAREVVPYQHDWDRQHMIDRAVFARAAKAGVYGLQIDERFGGAGESDYRYRMVVCEELARIFAFSFGLTVSLQDGELIGALAMTEPGAGSDLKGIRTSARRDGERWIINGQKTFISSGIMADVVVVAARTGLDSGSRAFSLFVVERDTPGFERGRQLEKIGLAAQDTAELFFHDAVVPAANLAQRGGQGAALPDEPSAA
jgi:alkylation response protein AidB-like acyl-CoA dehydrogenase